MINSSEPMKKKYKSIEDQFADPDESSNEASLFIQPSVSQKTDELDKYMKMARRLFSIPATSANVERQAVQCSWTVSE